MKKFLEKSDINLVAKKFRSIVQAAFDRGEKIPYDVVLLSDKPVTEKEIEWVNRLVKEGKITDE